VKAFSIQKGGKKSLLGAQRHGEDVWFLKKEKKKKGGPGCLVKPS